MRRVIVGLLMMVMFSGCGAGMTHDVLTYDNIIAAAKEAKVGVDAFNEAVIAESVNRQEQLIKSVGDGIRTLAQEQAIDAEQADALAETVVASLKGHLANYAEQERRRAHLYEVTIDNLDYIIEISGQGRKFSIYRADIGVQWREYLESSGRDAIQSIK